MNTTRRYTVLIVRGYSGHIAFTPRLPDVVGRGRGRNSAYKDFRVKLQKHIAGLVDRGVPVLEDDIVSVKYLKVDLRALEEGGYAAVHLVFDQEVAGRADRPSWDISEPLEVGLT